MKVKIKHTFDGYPGGNDASKTTFAAGSVHDLPDEFAALIIKKSHAEQVVTAAAQAAAQAPAKPATT